MFLQSLATLNLTQYCDQNKKYYVYEITCNHNLILMSYSIFQDENSANQLPQ